MEGDHLDLACVVHVHSRYSDGTASVPQILDAARAARVDVVLLTDHDTLAALEDGWQGWHDGVLLLVGMEVSPRAGHLLALGISERVGHEEGDERRILARVREQNGIAIAAHPFSEGSRMSRRVGRPHPWGTLDDPALAGIELWSMTTDTAESWPSPRVAVRELQRPENLDGPPPRNLQLWDALCRRRPTVAVGGLDAHQPGIRIGRRLYSPMPHARWFRLLRTHVMVEKPLSGAVEPDRAAVLAAIAAGRCYLSLDHLGDPRGFAFDARGGAGTLAMGSAGTGDDWTLHAAAPGADELLLIRDGGVQAREPHPRLEHTAEEPGVYRVEAFRGGRRWIVSNPIYLR